MQPSGSTSSKGVAVLVLGILGLVSCGCLAGIPAWLLGNRTLAEIRAGRLDASEYGLTQAGRVLGIISTAVTALLCLFFLVTTALQQFAISPTFGRDPFSSPNPTAIIAEEQRIHILGAAEERHSKHPDQTYERLAQDLAAAAAAGKKVKWYKGPLQPPEGCGTYRFRVEGDALTLTDACGSSSTARLVVTEPF
jgi:hypothetical protein